MIPQIIVTALVCFLTGVAVSYRAAKTIIAGKNQKIQALTERLAEAEGWEEED